MGCQHPGLKKTKQNVTTCLNLTSLQMSVTWKKHQTSPDEGPARMSVHAHI